MFKALFSTFILLAVLACGNKRSTQDSLKVADSHFGKETKEERFWSPDLKNDLGFQPLSAPEIPRPVSAAAQSVFALRVLAAGDENSLRELDVTEGKGKEIKAKIQALDSETFDNLDKIALIKQVEQCEDHPSKKVQKSCFITVDVRQSTGFIAGSGATLWTNAHVVEGFLNAIEKYENISKENQFKNKKELRIFVFDRDGKLLINPYKDKVTLQVLPKETEVAKFRNNFYAEDSDYIGLSLSRSIGNPLPIAKEKSNVGNRVFVLGFPACTGCQPQNVQVKEMEDFADRTPGMNSDGKGMKVSSGVIVNSEGLASFFGIQETSMSYWRLDRMLFSTADSNHGSSGGPVLNEKGEVLAIHRGGKSRLINGKHKRVSQAVIFPSRNAP